MIEPQQFGQMGRMYCDVCSGLIGYTNERIPESKPLTEYSDKLSAGQALASVRKRKLIYCPKCHDEGIKKAREELERERWVRS